MLKEYSDFKNWDCFCIIISENINWFWGEEAIALFHRMFFFSSEMFLWGKQMSGSQKWIWECLCRSLCRGQGTTTSEQYGQIGKCPDQE